MRSQAVKAYKMFKWAAIVLLLLYCLKLSRKAEREVWNQYEFHLEINKLNI